MVSASTLPGGCVVLSCRRMRIRQGQSQGLHHLRVNGRIGIDAAECFGAGTKGKNGNHYPSMSTRGEFGLCRMLLLKIAPRQILFACLPALTFSFRLISPGPTAPSDRKALRINQIQVRTPFRNWSVPGPMRALRKPAGEITTGWKPPCHRERSMSARITTCRTSDSLPITKYSSPAKG